VSADRELTIAPHIDDDIPGGTVTASSVDSAHASPSASVLAAVAGPRAGVVTATTPLVAVAAPGGALLGGDLPFTG